MIERFAANKLVLHLDATDIIKCITKNSSHSTLRIGYREKHIGEAVNTTFLGLQIDNHLNWKDHIEQIIPKLSAACYAVRSTVHISNINTLKSVYCAYFHSIIKYGISICGKSSNGGKIVTLQKKIIRCTTQNLMQKSVEAIIVSTRSMPVYTSLMKFITNN
jgi:hypothetical protein